jgi:hypothetical protein
MLNAQTNGWLSEVPMLRLPRGESATGWEIDKP